MVVSVGVGGLVASTVGGIVQGNATNQAAKKAAGFDQQAYQQQIAAGNQANSQDQAIYNTEATNLNPTISLGNQAAGQLSSQLPALTAQFTGANLASTPGYQFTLQQGLEQAQNGFASRGLASSGAALKGGEQYATGLAQSTYNQQLQNYLSQNNQIYSMLNGTANLGAQSAAALGNSQAGVAGGNALVQSAQGAAGSLQDAGTAYGAGITGSTSQYSNPLTTLGNFGQVYTLNNLLQNSSNASAFNTDKQSGGMGVYYPTAQQANEANSGGSNFPGYDTPLS
jgi:hypothetical protein